MSEKWDTGDIWGSFPGACKGYSHFPGFCALESSVQVMSACDAERNWPLALQLSLVLWENVKMTGVSLTHSSTQQSLCASFSHLNYSLAAQLVAPTKVLHRFSHVFT